MHDWPKNLLQKFILDGKLAKDLTLSTQQLTSLFYSPIILPTFNWLNSVVALQNIVESLDAAAAATGRETIAEALESMTRVAQHINEMKRKHEHAVRVQEVQSTLSDWDGADLTTYGDLVLEVRSRPLAPAVNCERDDSEGWNDEMLADFFYWYPCWPDDCTFDEQMCVCLHREI